MKKTGSSVLGQYACLATCERLHRHIELVGLVCIQTSASQLYANMDVLTVERDCSTAIPSQHSYSEIAMQPMKMINRKEQSIGQSLDIGL
jgi:uroporphyrinogen-III decarboxylase